MYNNALQLGRSYNMLAGDSSSPNIRTRGGSVPSGSSLSRRLTVPLLPERHMRLPIVALDVNALPAFDDVIVTLPDRILEEHSREALGHGARPPRRVEGGFNYCRFLVVCPWRAKRE